MLKKILVLIAATALVLPICVIHATTATENQNEESIQQTRDIEYDLTPSGLLGVQVDEADTFPAPETQTILTE